MTVSTPSAAPLHGAVLPLHVLAAAPAPAPPGPLHGVCHQLEPRGQVVHDGHVVARARHSHLGPPSHTQNETAAWSLPIPSTRILS